MSERLIEIKYCGPCNYLPKAAKLANRLRAELTITSSLVEATGGVFDVSLDGRLLYSKTETGEFPNFTKLIARIETELSA